MSDNNHNFHKFALNSILFKGRSDWYFCYLKSEKIGHVLAMLAENPSSNAQDRMHTLALSASDLPQAIVHFVAGEVDVQVILADIFALISAIRLAGTSNMIRKENIIVLVQEYEMLAEKFAAGMHLSPFATAEDFIVPSIGQEASAQSLLSNASSPLSLPNIMPHETKHAILAKDLKEQVGMQDKREKDASSGQHGRIEVILNLVRKSNGISIKGISAVVRDCSEKTIQRELAQLIQKGFVKKVGERRWSVYLPV